MVIQHDSFCQWPLRVPQISKTLVDLPPEVLTEALKPLPWKDVLHLRLICKYLSQVSRAKSTWINLFDASNAAHPWSPLRLERPMEFYSSHELEYLVVRRESDEIKRKTQNKLHPALTRRLPIDKPGIGAFTLINGGRWLLSVSYTGSVSYYDLDMKDPVKRTLVRRIRGQGHGNSNPSHSSMACNPPTRRSESWVESLSDPSILFSSRNLWFTASHFSPWKIYRLRSWNGCKRTHHISLYCDSELGRSQRSGSVTSPSRIEAVISEENHSSSFGTGTGKCASVLRSGASKGCESVASILR